MESEQVLQPICKNATDFCKNFRRKTRKTFREQRGGRGGTGRRKGLKIPSTRWRKATQVIEITAEADFVFLQFDREKARRNGHQPAKL
jgi:hypothetical protein